jgi:DNA-binding MarR family transcriptional regulator
MNHVPSTTPGAQPGASTPPIAMFQRAFLLGQLATEGAGSKSAGDLNKKIPAAAKRELHLTNDVAAKVRGELAAEKYLEMRRDGRTVLFAITEAGRAYLASLEQPVLSGRTKKAVSVNEDTIPPELREGQRAYLLLQLLDAEGQTLTQGEANKIPKGLVVSLGLKPAVANHRRTKLAEQGYIKISSSGRSKQVSLTPDGRDYLLAGAKHLDHAPITLKGKTLNALVSGARESSFERDQPAGQSEIVPIVPNRAELAEAVLAEFRESLRERHSRSGLVPIHEVRQRVAERCGATAARHDVLDEIILDLWREHRLGLEGISDLSSATEQQLNDSIQGVNSTLFYLEVPREQPVNS